MRIWLAHLQPTIMRLNTSTMKQTCSHASPGRHERQIGHPEPVRGCRGELSLHQVRMSRGSRIGPGRLDPLRARCALDAGSAHQPTGLVAANVEPVAAGCLPKLANPVNPVVVPPEPHQFRGEDSVADRSRRRGANFRGVIPTRSHLQQSADGSTPSGRPSTTSSLFASMNANTFGVGGQASPRRNSQPSSGSRPHAATRELPAPGPALGEHPRCSPRRRGRRRCRLA